MNRADRNLALMRSDPESDWHERLLRRMAATDLDLTPAERDTLRAMSHGMTDEEAGALLGVSRAAIKSRLILARRKLRAKNTTHAVARAIWADLL